MVNDECFQSARKIELSQWKHINVYLEVQYSGQQSISLKRVCSFKNIGDTLVANA